MTRLMGWEHAKVTRSMTVGRVDTGGPGQSAGKPVVHSPSILEGNTHTHLPTAHTDIHVSHFFLLSVHTSLPPFPGAQIDPPTKITPPRETPFIFCLFHPTAFWNRSFHILLGVLQGLHPSTRTESLLQRLSPSARTESSCRGRIPRAEADRRCS